MSVSIVKRTPDEIEFLPDNQQYTNRFEVNSETSDRVYTMAQRKSSGEWSCSCPGWIRWRKCKHMTAIRDLIPLLERRKEGVK